MIRIVFLLVVILAFAALFFGSGTAPTLLLPQAPDVASLDELEEVVPVVLDPVGREGGEATARPAEPVDSRTPFRGRVSGYVVEPSGIPIPGVQVGIGPKRRHADITDRRGEFTLRNFPPGESFRLFASASGYGWARSEPITLKAGEIRDGVSITMFKRATISGRVYDAKGACIVGAKVQLFLRSSTGWNSMTSVRTDEQGAYRLREALPGQTRLQVFLDGWPARHDEILLDTEGGDDIPDVEIRLRPEFEIRGTVSAKDGRLLGRVLIEGTCGGGRPLRVVSAADGTWLLKGLPEPEVVIGAVWKSGRPRSPRVTVRGGAEGVELLATGSGWVRGQVRPTRGPGVISITVDLVTPGPGSSRVVRSVFVRDDVFVLEDLEPGTWRLAVRYPNLVSEPVEVLVVEDGPATEVAINLHRSTAFQGRVVRVDGSPVDSPTLTLRGDRILERTVKGRKNGHFQFRNLFRGAHVLTVVAGDAPPREYAVNVPGSTPAEL